jgi:voltage-gated potassium channel
MVATGEAGPTFQQKAYRAVAPHAWPRGISPFNKIVLALIVLASLLAILETEEGLLATAPRLFLALDLAFGILFSAEFGLRLWAAGVDPRWSGVRGRIRWLLRPISIIDLIAILPSFLALVGPDAFLLRLVRLARILRLARLGQFSDAMQLIYEAVRSRRYELGVSLLAAGAVLLLSAIMLYLVEGDVQPEAYGSIPRALWWSIVTLTTVGYGDVYPVTLAGRMLGGLTALAGIGLIAMPTGILAAAFSDAFQKRRARNGGAASAD